MNRIHILIFISVFATNLSFSQTALTGTFSSDTIISNSLSPYLISSTIIINNGATFTVESGTIIYFDNGMSIAVDNATLNINGNVTDSVYLLNNGTQWGRISGQYANINIAYCVFEYANQMISANYGEIRMNNSSCSNVTGGDAVALHYSDSVFINDCNFAGIKNTGKIDCIDADAINYGLIFNNIFTNWNDDAIDIGTSASNLIIHHNYAENCDYGVSVGENSDALLYRNIMVDGHGGIESHTGAIVTAYNNTIFNNDYGFSCNHGAVANSGGTIYLRNTIISQSVYANYSIQPSSNLTISYSCSDTDTLPGIGNVFGYPQFVDSLNNDFHLTLGSNCIDTGDPNDPLDTNGNYIDIGVYEFYDTTTVISQPNRSNFIKLYPNPSSESFMIEGNQINKIVIFDIEGKQVFSRNYNTEQNRIEINVNRFNQGLYLVRVNTFEGITEKKLIIK